MVKEIIKHQIDHNCNKTVRLLFSERNVIFQNGLKYSTYIFILTDLIFRETVSE
jgi:hypothetical protein